MDSVVRSMLRVCFDSFHYDLTLLMLALSASDIRFSLVSFEDIISLTILLRTFRNFDHALSSYLFLAFLCKRLFWRINFQISLCIYEQSIGLRVTVLWRIETDAASKITEVIFSVTSSISPSKISFHLA